MAPLRRLQRQTPCSRIRLQRRLLVLILFHALYHTPHIATNSCGSLMSKSNISINLPGTNYEFNHKHQSQKSCVGKHVFPKNLPTPKSNRKDNSPSTIAKRAQQHCRATAPVTYLCFCEFTGAKFDSQNKRRTVATRTQSQNHILGKMTLCSRAVTYA